MFSDPLVAVMAMLLLFFAGMVLMFAFFTRSLTALREDLRESMRKQQMFLSDVEQQFMRIEYRLRVLPEGGDAGKSPSALQKPDDISLLRQEDPLLSMLENTARKAASAPGFDDQLLSVPSRKNAPARDYDPANDPGLFEDAFLAAPGARGGRSKRGL